MKHIYCLLIFFSSFFTNCGILFRGKTSFIHVAAGQLLLNQPLPNVNGTIIRDSQASISGESITFSGGVLQDAHNNLTISAVLNPSGQILLNGNKTLEGDGGTVQQQIVVSNTDNKIDGFLILQSDIALQDTTTTLSVAVQSVLNKNIALNGGSLYLQDNLWFSDYAGITGSGSVNTNGYSVFFNGQDFAVTSTLEWTDDVTIYLNGKILLSGTWTCDGICIINGRGNTLDLSHGGKLVINPGATLILKNIQIAGIHTGNIILMSDSSSLQLDDVSWIQDGNYVFDTGSLLFVDTNDFIGSFTFLYQSAFTSTIKEHSEWNNTGNITLNIGRKNFNNGIEPLYFADGTAVIKFDNASMVVTSSGVNFTRGKLLFDKEGQLDILGTTTATGLIFGDGIEANDFTIEFASGASLNFNQGYLVYNNFSSDKLISNAKSATVTRFENSRVHVAQDWVLPLFTIRVDVASIPQTTIALGKTLSYADTHQIYPQVEFEVTGSQNGSGYWFLTGNDSIFFTKGYFPLPIFVSGANNQLRGNADIRQSIVLQDSASSLVFDLDGCVENSIIGNNGTIDLSGDLCLGRDSIVSGFATINLNNHQIYLGEQDFDWTGTTLWSGSNAGIHLNSTVDLSGTWTIDGICIVNGNGNVLNLASGAIAVTANSTLILQDVAIRGISGTNIHCLDDSSRILLDSASWSLTNDAIFDRGSLLFVNDVEFAGTYTFFYESSQTSTIDTNSQWIIHEGMTLKIGRSNLMNSVEPLAFVDNTSVLKCNASTLLIADYGAQFTKGKLVFDGKSFLDIVGTETTNGMIMGNGNIDDDFTLLFNSGASMSFLRGFYVYNNAGSDGLKAMSKTASVTRYADSKVYIAHNWTLPSWTLRVAPGGAPLTQLAPGIAFGYDNTNLVFPGAEMDLTACQTDSITFWLTGDNFVYFTKGDFNLPILVSGTNNELRGNGSIVGPVTLNDGSAQLIINLQGHIHTDVTMNGGTILLSGDLQLVDGAIFTGTGTVNLSSNSIDLGSKDAIWTSTLLWQGNNATIQLNSEIEIAGTWTMQGVCIINGNGNTLNLGNTGELIVDSSSQLILRNIYVKNISQNAIRCLDDSACIVLDNVAWIQDGDATFEYGSIEFLNEVDFVGTYTFHYDSSQTSTIREKSKWSIRDFMTLSIGRKTPASNEPLYFEETTSILEFDNADVRVTQNGLRVTNGTLLYNRDVTVDILSTSTVNGLEFGDGITAHDPILQVSPGAVIHFADGHFVYNITSSTNLRSNSNTARIARDAGSTFYIKQDLVLPEITIKANPLATMIIENGKTLIYDNCTITTNQIEFSLIGSRYSTTANLLSGNDLIFITRGTLPLATLVSGIGNRLVGNGSVSGPIMLLNSAAQLNCGVEGAVSADITLNGGTVLLERNLYLTQGAEFVGQGTVNLGSFAVEMAADTVWTSTVAWIGNNATIECGASIDLSGTWTLSGSCIISAQGNTLDLSHGGELVVDHDSQVIIRNARIYGLHDSNLKCLGNTSSITLDNVLIILDNNYTFSTGSLLFNDSVTLAASGYSFVYQSQETSTIQSNSKLIFDEGLTFSYDPGIASTQLLAFADDTAELQLIGGSMYITSTGMQMIDGSIKVLQDSTVYTEGDVGLVIGNNNALHDAHIYIATGVSFKIQGIMQYRNINTSSLTLVNDKSRLAFLENSTLYLYETMTLGLGIIEFYENTTLAYLLGKQIDGSTFGFGTLNFLLLT